MSESFEISETFALLREKALRSHEMGRGVFHLTDDDVALARLYSYGFRAQTIGAFHAGRQLLEASVDSADEDPRPGQAAASYLKQLQDLAILPVPSDFRSVISTFFYYDHLINAAIQSMNGYSASRSDEIETIRNRFITAVERVSLSDGICVTRDDELPEQATFDVPGLEIKIVSLVYGDHHSWNTAYLGPKTVGVTTHRHRAGVEIHLGFEPVYGRSIFGDCCAIVHEGYAMPIPAGIDHAFENLSDEIHVVPFVFGSRVLSGWGVFADVEPRTKDSEKLPVVDLESEELNHSIYLEREIARVEAASGTGREVGIAPSLTRSGEVGALELGILQVGPEALNLTTDVFRILSVRTGSVRVEIGPASAELGAHDHVGVPSGLEARVCQEGKEPAILLDAVIRE